MYTTKYESEVQMLIIIIIHTLVHFSAFQKSSLFLDIANWLTSQEVSLFLTCITFLGFLYQLYSRRINFAGIVGFIALLMIFLGFIIQGSISLVTLSTFIIGVLFIVIELFIVGAILGIIGLLLVTFSLITMGDNLSMMLFNVIVAMILTVIEWVILVKFFKKRISLFDQVVLKDSTSKESGYTSHNDNTYLVGQNATTLTDLRPSGIIVLDNQRIDAVSEGSFIMKDTAVKIIEVEGTRVVVREQNSK